MQDVLIAVVDGLKGAPPVLASDRPPDGLPLAADRRELPEAITAAFPDAMVQTCIVHLVRHSLNFCAWKDRKEVAADLRQIYSAPTADQAAADLDAFEELEGSGNDPGDRFLPTTGREICHDCPGLTAGMARGDPVLCLRSVRRYD